MAKAENIPVKDYNELTKEQIIDLAMEQIRSHLLYCSRWKLKSSVAAERIQGTLQEMVASLELKKATDALKLPSEETSPNGLGGRVGLGGLGDSRPSGKL